MRYLRAIGFTCLVLLLAASVASADDAFPIGQNPGQLVIHSQRPDMNDDPALNWSSTRHMGTTAAADWYCYGPGEIYEIHWWGCFLGSQTVQPDVFIIKQWNHTGITPLSEPTDPICSWGFNSLEYQVAQVPGTDIWEYYIPDFPCHQDPIEFGTDMYFLSIQAWYPFTPEPEYDWGWHEAPDVFRDTGVQDTGGAPPYDWQPILRDGEYRDLAFEMSGQNTKPEPATLSLLLTGLAALGVRLRRRKKS